MLCENRDPQLCGMGEKRVQIAHVGLCIALTVNRNGCYMCRFLDFSWVGVGKIGDR